MNGVAVGVLGATLSRGSHLPSTTECSGNLVLDSLGGCPLYWQRPPSEVRQLPWLSDASRKLWPLHLADPVHPAHAENPSFSPVWLPQGNTAVFMKTEHVIQTSPSDLAQLRIRGHSFTSPSCHWTLQAKAGLPLGGSQNLADGNESGVGVKLRCQTEWPGPPETLREP